MANHYDTQNSNPLRGIYQSMPTGTIRVEFLSVPRRVGLRSRVSDLVLGAIC